MAITSQALLQALAAGILLGGLYTIIAIGITIFLLVKVVPVFGLFQLYFFNFPERVVGRSCDIVVTSGSRVFRF